MTVSPLCSWEFNTKISEENPFLNTLHVVLSKRSNCAKDKGGGGLFMGIIMNHMSALITTTLDSLKSDFTAGNRPPK